MSSIVKRARIAKVKDKRTGETREREVEFWRARYRDDAGKEHARHFERKVDAQKWLDEQTASLVTGNHVAPKTAKTTVGEWCDTWLEGYATRRATTVRQAKVHVRQIKAEFGGMRLSVVRPSHVKAWCAKLRQEGGDDSAPLSASYVYALHNRLAQIMADAVHDGIIPRSPCSRRTSPGAGDQRPYVATTEQVWALYDAMPERMGAAVLLGAFAGLRLAEACGHRTEDTDFMRGVVHPRWQYPAEPLKTDYSKTPVPVGGELMLQLSAHAARWPGETLLTGLDGGQLSPWALERGVRAARAKVRKCGKCGLAQARPGKVFRCQSAGCDGADGGAGLPAGFRYHDLRHYLASLLIANGADVKTVQARLRHGSATTTLNTYSHLWPDKDESTKAIVDSVIKARFEGPADSSRTAGGAP
jgi:integrase